ncbi:unnamed protein product [Didymodactylos carnosus]|nr:unnamed protein product [Didymodactylos carnosus]CAF3604733.1 unnamed protein product [Didymodactylos carnosus]
MTIRRRHVGVCAVAGRVYAIGGHDGNLHLNSAEAFDPQTNRWQQLSPMATWRRGIAVGCLGGPLFAVGGLDDSTCFDTVERYDVENNSWSTVASMSTARGGVAVAALKGYLYACGGNDGSSSLNSCERYCPAYDKWTPIAPMNKRRAGASVTVLNNKLYILGGFDDNSPLDSVECFEPDTNTWTMVTPMTSCRGGVGSATLAGNIYSVGGHDGQTYLKTVEAYDPETQQWSPVAGINICRAGAGVSQCDIPVSMLIEVKNPNPSSYLMFFKSKHVYNCLSFGYRGISSRSSVSSSNTDDYSYCINSVRKYDYENFLCVGLLKPIQKQRSAIAIRAFNVELAQIRDNVSDQQIGRMRLQFWRDTVDDCFSLITATTPKIINNPVARELTSVIIENSNRLSKLWFQRLITSRETTLNDMPFDNMDKLEAYIEQSVTPIYYLLLELYGQRTLNSDHIASHLGRAQGIVNIVRGIPYNAVKRRCFIPLSYLIQHNISQQDIFNLNFSNEHVRLVIFDMCTRAYYHMKKAIDLFENDKTFCKKKLFVFSNDEQTIFLPLIALHDYLRRIKEIDFDLSNKQAHVRNHLLVWKLWLRKFPKLKHLSSST